ncbi:MBL fold metallo-hydrolase RNA specificity domain-containing protein [Deinococcus lacus]|uniref:MBL fold metallo-hydrolase RNA specificity domain-containing protein n=1 Tax=Deinococcus lacus TaxID=392561 RepID=A0ABW1YG27_9DEIO
MCAQAVTLTSFGAARTVSGSLHLLDLDAPVAVDCGQFQGSPELEALNHQPLGFEPRDLSAVFLTHAHLDHVGRLPLLTRRGYRGPVYCTPATAALCEIVLLDAARIEVERYTQQLRAARRSGLPEDAVLPPLFEPAHVQSTLAQLRPELTFGEPLRHPGGGTVTPLRAGHILGSASLLFRTRAGRLLMSGDLGHWALAGAPLRGLQRPPESALADAAVLETTYAHRRHQPWASSVHDLAEILRGAVQRGGKILMPSFATERTQLLLWTLKTLMESGDVPHLPVFLDSPMAARATQEYFRFAGELRPDLAEAVASGLDPFSPSGLHTVKDAAESGKLARFPGPAILVAGNGMLSGGRMVRHLQAHLGDPAATIVLTGYQAPATPGGQLQAGAATITLGTERLEVRAQVRSVAGFSAHGDQATLLNYLAAAGWPSTWLVHGEPGAMTEFAGVLAGRGVSVAAAAAGETVRVLG